MPPFLRYRTLKRWSERAELEHCSLLSAVNELQAATSGSCRRVFSAMMNSFLESWLEINPFSPKLHLPGILSHSQKWTQTDSNLILSSCHCSIVPHAKQELGVWSTNLKFCFLVSIPPFHLQFYGAIAAFSSHLPALPAIPYSVCQYRALQGDCGTTQGWVDLSPWLPYPTAVNSRCGCFLNFLPLWGLIFLFAFSIFSNSDNKWIFYSHHHIYSARGCITCFSI